MSNSLVLTLTPDISLSHYLQQIRSFPMLAPAEEFMLAKSWREHGDVTAAHKLVTSHLRLVAKIAMGFRGYGLPLGELISEGNVGMMQAVKRFEPDRGFRLSTYAMWWIKASIQEYVLRSWSLVKIGTTAAQKKLFFNLRRAKSKLQSVEDGVLNAATIKKISTELNVSEAEVISMNGRLSGPDRSLNAPMSIDGEGEWLDRLEDDRDNQETVLAETEEYAGRKKLLDGAMVGLKDRERDILIARRLQDEPATLEQLSEKYDISRERVRQIEVRAFDKLQKSITSEARAQGLAT